MPNKAKANRSMAWHVRTGTPPWGRGRVTDDIPPHSRACGPTDHEHGRDCSFDCPTCRGVGHLPDETPGRAMLREYLIDFAEWLAGQGEVDGVVVDDYVDRYLGLEADHPLSPATRVSIESEARRRDRL